MKFSLGRVGIFAGVLLSLSLIIAANSRAEVRTYGIISDAGVWNENSRKVHASMLKSGVFPLIMAGDNLYDTRLRYGDVWDHWKKSGFEFLITALGNHHRSYGEEMEYFGMPSEYFSKVDGSSRFIVLNSDNMRNVDAQIDWFKHELAQAQEQFVFVVFHHSPYTITLFHHWREKEKFQRAVRPLLQQYSGKITALIVGHDHIATLLELGDHGLPMVVSGSVFDERKTIPLNYRDDGVRVKTRWLFPGGFYWTRMDVNTEESTVWLNFVRSEPDQVSCSARIYPRPMLLRPNCGRR